MAKPATQQPAAPRAAAPAMDLAKVSPDRLKFDLQNPRLYDQHKSTDAEIIQYLIEHADLEELLQSISISGYIDFDPLIVMKEGQNYVVLEGNRRLAAVRLLRSKKLQEELNASVPSITAAKLQQTDSISVRAVKSRADARAYIGFKHINGPAKWDSLAKAQFAAQWLIDEKADIDQIARTFGDTHQTVRRLIFGFLVLKQAEANGFDESRRQSKRFSFSHLYTALTRPGYRSVLGLPENPADSPLKKNPIRPNHLDDLMTVMGWLYGDRENDQPPLIRSQNPDLNRLNNVLLVKVAQKVLYATRDLDRAVEHIEPKSQRFSDALINAAQMAQQAAGLVVEYDKDESLLDTAKSLSKNSDHLVTVMQQAVGKGR
jgi:hypothetical protein